MKLLVLKGSSPRHEYFAERLEAIQGIEVLELTPHRLGMGRLKKMLFKQPKTFFARVGKYVVYGMMGWDRREREFFGAPDNTDRANVAKRNVESLNDSECLKIAKDFAPDMIASFGIPIISDDLIAVPKWGAVNLHGGISPEYKGGNTIFWPLLQGKPEMAGATLHYMVAKVDSGRLLAKVYPKLDSHDDECSASCKTFKDATDEFVRLVEWARDNGRLPEGSEQVGESHLYKAVHRGFWVSIKGYCGIKAKMKFVDIPARVERFYA